MVSNSDGLYPDEDGDASDWIEIVNNSSGPLNIQGFALTDEEDNLFKWTFPSVEIQANEHLIVFCSNKDRQTAPFHTNFKIKSEGEILLLVSPEGDVIDHIDPTPLSEGFALTRICEAECYWELVDIITPEAPAISESIITFSSPSRVFESETEVYLTHSLGHEIRYTLNGSIPTAQSSLYTGPFSFGDATEQEAVFSYISTSYNWEEPDGEILQTNTIRAMSFSDGISTSQVFTKSYPIGPEIADLFQEYPVFSIQVDGDSLFDYHRGIHVPGVNFTSSNLIWSGNYFLRGEDSERDVHIEYFENGVLEWQQSAGLRIHGGRTRGYPQKSFRLYARNHLGAGEFNHEFFTTKNKRVFDKLILRTTMGCWNNTAIKDDVSAYVAKDLDFDSQHSRICLLFINGEFWGIFGIRDFFDRQYIEETHGYHEDSVSIINNASGHREGVPEDWGVFEGDNSHYGALADFMENADMNQVANYDYIKTQMDMSSMIDYYATEIYFNQKDWPGGNHKLWRGGGDTKWRWLLFDMDSGWGYLPATYNAWNRLTTTTNTDYSNPPWATFLLRKFLESPEFKEEFKARYACLMRNEFDPDAVSDAIDRFVDLYETGMEYNIDRWHNVNSMSQWHSNINSKLRTFNEERQSHAISNLSTFMNTDFSIEDYNCESLSNLENEIVDKSIMAIYPNPSSEGIWIDLSREEANATFHIYDIYGMLIKRGKYSSHQRIDIQQFAPGVYVAVVKANGQNYSRQFVKY
ncbi:MAG: CotH kinase family protein [Flavobacteriales bacterium]|nr:CotH kinase family protein [Flavobacteriales bacterium]